MTYGESSQLLRDKEDRIKAVFDLVRADDYSTLTARVQELFGVEYRFVERHPHNIKSIIRYKTFVFREGLSFSSRAFMILHTIGHYYFISSARAKGITRYEYIYDTEGQATSYERLGEEPRVVTPKMKRDRVAFEIGANRFGVALLRKIDMSHLVELVNVYQAGDIRYILDVTKLGRSAIVPTDYEYLNRYICNGLSYDGGDDDEEVFGATRFSMDGLNWEYLSNLNLEVHFF